MLAALGYEPVGFERPADAIAACRSAPDRFDIILVSHASQTPVGSIWRARCTRPRRGSPFCSLLPSTIDVSVDALAKAGISEVLRRPLVSTELAAALARCLRSQAHYNRNTITDSRNTSVARRRHFSSSLRLWAENRSDR